MSDEPQTRPALSRLKQRLRPLLYTGRNRYCPVCGRHSRKFLSRGVVPREDAACVHCDSLERHRLVWLFIQDRTNLLSADRPRMLHVAPEPQLERRLREVVGDGYLTGDLLDPRAMVVLDAMSIGFPDETFDVVYASHVLEHVSDDRQAMREFHRVLKTDGWAILLVPITAEITVEDPTIEDPQERLRLFGQEDHVRRYGPDYVDRLRQAGFTVEVTEVSDLVDAETARRFGLTVASGQIFFCTK